MSSAVWLLEMGVHPAEIGDLGKNKAKPCAELLRRANTVRAPVQLEVEKALEETEQNILWLPPPLHEQPNRTDKHKSIIFMDGMTGISPFLHISADLVCFEIPPS